MLLRQPEVPARAGQEQGGAQREQPPAGRARAAQPAVPVRLRGVARGPGRHAHHAAAVRGRWTNE